MPLDPEYAANQVPRFSDFFVKFSNLTQDGQNFDMSTVQGWVFQMGTQMPYPQVSKSSTGTASADFTINTTDRFVNVKVRATEINNGYGNYFVALKAFASGSYISHLQKWLTIQNSFIPSGV